MIFEDIYIMIQLSIRVGGVMVSVISSSVLDRGFEPRLGQTKDYQIGRYLLLLR
jgi:hypothetical protein